MKQLSKSPNLNYLAIELLEKLGNKTPTQQQIELMESLIARVGIEQRVSFSHKLSVRKAACLLLVTLPPDNFKKILQRYLNKSDSH